MDRNTNSKDAGGIAASYRFALNANDNMLATAGYPLPLLVCIQIM